MHNKLFIPGPVEVDPEVLKTMAHPMFGHRGREYEDLHAGVRDKLKKMLNTQRHVLLCTASATGAMEAAVRNLVGKRILSTTCGAFSERWHEIALANGKEADALAVEWGKGLRAEEIRKHLKTGKYDAISVVHNETSTGVMNRLDEIGEVVKEFPDVMFMVDAVSSMAAAPIDPDRWGIDLCLAGVQKGFGLPPGLTVIFVSDRALQKAATVPHRGYYFDLCDMAAYDKKNQTSATPAIPQIVALNAQLDRMLAAGMENVYRRVNDMAVACRRWAGRHFGLFPEPGYESPTMTTILNTRAIKVPDLVKELEQRYHMTISGGYGKLKEKTFRIGHLGHLTMDDLNLLLQAIDDVLGLKA